MAVYWILGSSSPVGTYLFNNLSLNNKVIGFCRNSSLINDKFLSIDFTNTIDFTNLIKNLLINNENYPTSVIFCQRFRNYSSDFIQDFLNAFQVEIQPVVILRNLLYNIRRENYNVSFIWLNSTAAYDNHIDINDAYHLIKANCSRLCKLYSYHDRNIFSWNTITLGELSKFSYSNYNDEKLNIFDNIANFSNGNMISSLNDLLSVILFLSNQSNNLLSGQDFNLNRGLNNLSVESILRRFIKNE